MSIPGSNLLRQALKVIRPTTIQVIKYNGRTLDANRNFLSTYDAPVDMQASVQAVNRERYLALGLDFQKEYIKIWISEDLIDLERDYSGDKFIYGGKEYQLIDQSDWFLQDGWASNLAVQVAIKK